MTDFHKASIITTNNRLTSDYTALNYVKSLIEFKRRIKKKLYKYILKDTTVKEAM